MELKEYQSNALLAFEKWRDALADAEVKSETAVAALQSVGADIPPDVRNYPKTAWQKLAATGDVASPSGRYADRATAGGAPIPHICFKVPTGGGKTLLGAAALERLNRPTGLVLWMVPSNAIYRQTKAALWNREHPYRIMLERASGGRVKVLEKDDEFTAGDAAGHLCVMLISLQAANRQKGSRDFLRMFRDSGRYITFFPDSDDALGDGQLLAQYPDLERHPDNGAVKHSLVNVFKMLRPVIVLDEAHKAYGQKSENTDEFVAAVNYLNPGMIIELSATPSARRSNLLVDISGVDLKAAEMIKLPVNIKTIENAEWQYTLGKAKAELERLDQEAAEFQQNNGRYIRPIAVVRVERTGANQRGGDRIHAEDVREHLTRNLSVPMDEVAVQSSSKRELDEYKDLRSEFTPVRWIITQAALMEGWDCPFAYLLVILDNIQAKRAVTQLIGRVMRQPDARHTGREALDQCYVYCRNTDVGEVVQFVKAGLEQEGMTGLDDDIRSPQSVNIKDVTIEMRERFRHKNIFLPKVLHTDGHGGWAELDYQRHILPALDLGAVGTHNPQAAHPDAPRSQGASVDMQRTADGAADGIIGDAVTAQIYDPQDLYVDKTPRIAWYARRLADVMPNPFQAARIAGEMLQRMRDAGQSDADIYGQRTAQAAQLRQHVTKALDQQAEDVFNAKLKDGEIRFDLEVSGHNHLVEKQFKIPIEENDAQLQRFGKSMQLSLFEPVYARHYNELERRFAFYLDEQKALQWWHRVAVRQRGDYYIQGWRRNRVWPDFVAMAGAVGGKPSVLVFETKGEHLQGNEDTEYKEKLYAALEKTFNNNVCGAGKMTINDGPAKGVFRLVFDRDGFPDAAGALSGLQGGYAA